MTAPFLRCRSGRSPSSAAHRSVRQHDEPTQNPMTWERFLILWGLIAPVIGGVFATWWAARQAEVNRQHERQRWERQFEVEQTRRAEDEERELTNDLRSRMESAFAQYLRGGMRLMTLPPSFFGTPEKQQAIDEFSAGFQQVLLVASSDCASKAVALWKKTLNCVNSNYDEDARAEIELEVRSLRAAFLKEAREDLANPVGRNANPGIKIEPALKIGGFNLTDVG